MSGIRHCLHLFHPSACLLLFSQASSPSAPYCLAARKCGNPGRTLNDSQRGSNHWMNWHAKDGTSSASISDYDWSMALTMADCSWFQDSKPNKSLSARHEGHEVALLKKSPKQPLQKTCVFSSLYLYIRFLQAHVDIRKAQGLVEVQWKSSRMSVDQCRTFWQHMTTSGSQANPLHNGHWNSEILARKSELPLPAKRKSIWAEMISDTDTIWYHSYIFRYELSLA